MKLLRSWPSVIPPNRPYVVDGMTRAVMANHDYSSVLRHVDDDVLLLEWDIAVDHEDLVGFARRAAKTPGDVLVAPYRIYYPHLPQIPIWAHRRWDGRPEGMSNPAGAVPVTDDAEQCNLFGLGLVYLPRDLIRGFLAIPYARHMGDVEFSIWHYRHVRRDVPIDWATRPVHLNQPIPRLE